MDLPSSFRWVDFAHAFVIAMPFAFFTGTVLAQASATTSPAGSASASAAVAPAAPLEEVNGYLKLGFERLSSYPFTPAPYDPAKPNVQPPSSADQIPERVKQLDGKKAVVTGFALPVKTEKGLVTELLLMKDPMMCCYGVIPNINEWIVVHMTNGGVRAIQDVPLSFYGRLHVKEIYDNGYLTGIYLLDGEKMENAK